MAGLRASHTASYTSAGTLRVGFEQVTDPSTAPGTFHPMVIAHPRTGRKALYLGRRQNAYVEGLPLAQSEALLDEVWSYVTRETAVSHPWSRGDVVMWDNRCVMHRRDALNSAARRTLHRTQLLSFELRAAA